MLERPWTEVAGVRIASGIATISPHVPPTHRWMMEGVVEMVGKFVEFLPDMDLAFNINNEFRVAVPWGEMRTLKGRAEGGRRRVSEMEGRARTGFVEGTIGGWQGSYMGDEPPYVIDVESEFFEAASFVSSFDRFGAVGCPPESPARKQRWWNRKAFCRDCAAPHSLGDFVQDWTLSGSICHQPDMADFHGLHLSPAAFKTTKKLFAIFSQSKIPTYNDILYPSPWNYMEKVTHDPSKATLFSQKENTVFWRGATSEGFSTQGSWQGMQRQRFVHLLNTTPNTTLIPLSLPTALISNKRPSPSPTPDPPPPSPYPSSTPRAAAPDATAPPKIANSPSATR